MYPNPQKDRTIDYNFGYQFVLSKLIEMCRWVVHNKNYIYRQQSAILVNQRDYKWT